MRKAPLLIQPCWAECESAHESHVSYPSHLSHLHDTMRSRLAIARRHRVGS